METERPKIREDLEAIGDGLSPEIEMVEGKADTYKSQLAKAKAAKIATAESLLERANKDPKVQKAIKKKPAAKKAAAKKARSSPKDGVATEDGDKTQEPQKSHDANGDAEPAGSADDSWIVKETPTNTNMETEIHLWILDW